MTVPAAPPATTPGAAADHCADRSADDGAGNRTGDTAGDSAGRAAVDISRGLDDADAGIRGTFGEDNLRTAEIAGQVIGIDPALAAVEGDDAPFAAIHAAVERDGLAGAEDADNPMLRAGAGTDIEIGGDNDGRLREGRPVMASSAPAAAETSNCVCIVPLRYLGSLRVQTGLKSMRSS